MSDVITRGAFQAGIISIAEVCSAAGGQHPDNVMRELEAWRHPVFTSYVELPAAARYVARVRYDRERHQRLQDAHGALVHEHTTRRGEAWHLAKNQAVKEREKLEATAMARGGLAVASPSMLSPYQVAEEAAAEYDRKHTPPPGFSEWAESRHGKRAARDIEDQLVREGWTRG